MKVGNRLACDKCGRIESSNMKIHPNPTDKSKHLCDDCRKVLYSQTFPSIKKEN